MSQKLQIMVCVGLSLAGWLYGERLEAQEKPVDSKLTAKKLETRIPVEMDYLLALPNNYEQEEKWPLVLFLHGAGERGDNLDKVKIHGPPKRVQDGHQFPFILVAPQCPSNRWWEPVSLSALLDQIEADYQVDPDRIYVTGLSMGGYGTWNLAAHSPERFAAIAPICGGGDKFVIPRRLRDQLPIWVFHGDGDRVVPIERSQELVDGLKRFKADVKFTIYPGVGHDSWTETYNNPEFYQWLLSHRLKDASKQD